MPLQIVSKYIQNFYLTRISSAGCLTSAHMYIPPKIEQCHCMGFYIITLSRKHHTFWNTEDRIDSEIILSTEVKCIFTNYSLRKIEHTYISSWVNRDVQTWTTATRRWDIDMAVVVWKLQQTTPDIELLSTILQLI